LIIFPQYATTGGLRVINNVTDADVSTCQVGGYFGGGCRSWRKDDAEAAPKVLKGAGSKTELIVAVFYQMQKKKKNASSFLLWLKLEALGLVFLLPATKTSAILDFEYHRWHNNASGAWGFIGKSKVSVSNTRLSKNQASNYTIDTYHPQHTIH